jgi:RND family efflux transporter MFP subunit
VVRPVRAIKVGDVAEIDNAWYPGTARATQEVDLSFRVSGPMIQRLDVGQEVKEGDIVARIDPRDYEVELRNVQGQLDETKAALKRAQGEFEREQNIFKQDPGATSQTAVERKREERDRAKANIASLEATVATAEDRLSYTYLKAPFNGKVVWKYAENFETVRRQEPVLRLLDTSSIEIVINIPESIISYVPYAYDLRAVFDPFPDHEIPAKIKEIGTEASQTTRTYPVRLIMEQPEDIKILAGMAGQVTGKARLPGEEGASKTIVIPVSAVFAPEAEKSYVWVIDESSMTVKRREVTTESLVDTGIPVTQGLQQGEWVATAGVHFLREGQKVRILNAKGGEQ